MAKTPVIVHLSYLQSLRAYAINNVYICKIERSFTTIATEYFRSLLVYSVKPKNSPKSF